MKERAWPTIVVGAVASTAVWAFSPWLTGHQEPWDAESLFYVVGLIVAGVFAGLLRPRPLWAHYLGAVAGQAAYELVFLAVGPLFVLGAEGDRIVTPDDVRATAAHHKVKAAILPGLAHMLMLEPDWAHAAKALEGWLATLD